MTGLQQNLLIMNEVIYDRLTSELAYTDYSYIGQAYSRTCLS